MANGRKYFQEISREIKADTPVFKVRYECRFNMGLIKSFKFEIDLSKVHKKSKTELDILKSLKQEKHFPCIDRRFLCQIEKRVLWRAHPRQVQAAEIRQL